MKKEQKNVRPIILRSVTGILMALIILFALYMLLRGHNAPGGGFIGALIACTAFVLYKFANGTQKARDIISIDPRRLCVMGVMFCLLAGAGAALFQLPFLTGIWLPAYLDGRFTWAISSVLLFDIGVFLTVVGSVVTIILALEEDH